MARIGNLFDMIDERIEAALERDRHAIRAAVCEVVSEIVHSALAEIVEQLKRDAAAQDAKLAHIQTLLASRPPLNPPSGPERPN